MKRFSFILILTSVLILSTSISSVNGDINLNPGEISVASSHLTISNTTEWNGLIDEKLFNGTIRVSSGGTLRIENSILNLTNFSTDLTDPGNVILVQEGGILEIHNSKIIMNAAGQGIKGGVLPNSISGYISIKNSTLESINNDILNINGDYNLQIDNSIFQNSGDHGIAITDLERDLTITNSIFRYNTQDGINIDMLEPFSSYTINLQNLTVMGNGDDGISIDNEDGIIKLHDLTVIDNGDDGIAMGSVAAEVTLSNSLVEGNGNRGAEIVNTGGNILLNYTTVIDNYDDGIQLEEANNATVINSQFDLNGIRNPDRKHGLQLDNNADAKIVNSTFDANTGDGLNILAGNLVMYDLQITDSGDEGIQYDGGFQSVEILLDNLLIDGALRGDGIKFRNVNGNIQITNSQIFGGDDGIQVELGANSIFLENITSNLNRESGVELEDVANITIMNSSFNQNSGNGLQISDSSNVTLTGIDVTYNHVSGIEVISSTLNINQISVVNNSGIPAGSDGLIVQNSNFTITNSEFSENTGDGITLISSTGNLFDLKIQDNGLSGIVTRNSNSSLSKMTVLSNQLHGIDTSNSSITITHSDISNNHDNGLNLLSNSNFEIKNNTIQGNQNSGIFIGNSSIGIIHFNQFGNNTQYAIQAASRNDGIIVDANYNNFGSDEGPLWQRSGSNGRDGVLGPVNVSLVLTSTGDVIGFTPPVIEPEFLGFTIQEIILYGGIILLVIGVISLFVGSYYYQTWKETTNPRNVLVISPSGLPIDEYHFHKSKADGALISGFLSAISSFGAEVVEKSTEGFRIREISYDNFTILLDKVHTSMVAIVVDKSNWLIKRRAKQLSIDIFNKYPELEPKPKEIFNVNYLEGFEELVKFHLREFMFPEGH